MFIGACCPPELVLVVVLRFSADSFRMSFRILSCSACEPLRSSTRRQTHKPGEVAILADHPAKRNSKCYWT